MALKDYVFDLSSVVVAGTGIISVKSGSEIVATVDAGTAGLSTGPVVIDGFGTLTYNTTSNAVTFKADAGLPEGSYSVSLKGAASHVSLDAFNASKVSKGITLIADKEAEFVGTAGEDTVSITAGSASVRGGFGADTFVFSDKLASSVEDYKYSEGDVVSLGFDASAIALASDGKFTADVASVKADENNSEGLFYVDLNKKDGSKVLMATASGHKSEVSVTLSDKAGVVDVSAADTAVVDLGQGNDTITATNTALTLKVGRADGTANELKQVLDKDDTLALLNGDLGIVSVDSDGDLTFGDTTIQKAVDKDNQSEFKVSFDGGKTASVAAAGKDVITVKASDLPDFYVGIGNNGTKVSVQSATTEDVVIDLSDNSKISGKVNYIDATNATGNATLKGRAKEATTIQAGAVIAGKTQEIYTGTGKDSVALAASSAGVFKVHLSNAEGNADTVTGFDLANDILVLDDVAKLAVDTFSVNGGDLLLKTSQASIEGAVSDGKDVQVQLSGADKAIKVALAQDGNSFITAHKDTDVVLNVKDTVAAGVSYVGAAFADAFEVNLNDTDKYIGTFVSVNASGAGQAALVLGKDGVDNNVTIDGGSVVWGGANSNDTLTIKRDDVDGGSIVWTGAAGGNDTLANYDGTKDVIYSYDRATWTNEAIKSDVTFDSVSSAVIINSADGSTLNIGQNSGANLLLMGNQMEVSKVAIANATTSVAAYASDVNVYLSAKANTTVKVDNSAVAEGDSAVIDLSANNLMGAGKTYGDNITNIDAHESAGSFLLVGANVSRSKITGGQTMNVLYGGGNADQIMTGVDAARDLFWFGSTDGHDTISNFDAKRDVVYLWSTTNIDDVTVSSISDSAATVVFEATGSTLNINGTGIANTTFMVRDGADGYNYYTYDAENKAFVKKQ